MKSRTRENWTYGSVRGADGNICLYLDNPEMSGFQTRQDGNLLFRLIDGVPARLLHWQEGVGNRLQLNYPGGKVISSCPDELDRISKIGAGAYSPTSTDPIISARKVKTVDQFHR